MKDKDKKKREPANRESALMNSLSKVNKKENTSKI
jgi:hypothetical protein